MFLFASDITLLTLFYISFMIGAVCENRSSSSHFESGHIFLFLSLTNCLTEASFRLAYGVIVHLEPI